MERRGEERRGFAGSLVGTSESRTYFKYRDRQVVYSLSLRDVQFTGGRGPQNPMPCVRVCCISYGLRATVQTMHVRLPPDAPRGKVELALWGTYTLRKILPSSIFAGVRVFGRGRVCTSRSCGPLGLCRPVASCSGCAPSRCRGSGIRADVGEAGSEQSAEGGLEVRGICHSSSSTHGVGVAQSNSRCLATSRLKYIFSCFCLLLHLALSLSVSLVERPVTADVASKWLDPWFFMSRQQHQQGTGGDAEFLQFCNFVPKIVAIVVRCFFCKSQS